MKQSELIADLISRTNVVINKATEFGKNDPEVLNLRPSENGWSVLECLEHLNLYGHFYLKELEQRINSARAISGDPDFKSGWFGERTVQSMVPKNGVVNKMNAFKNKTPDPSTLDMRTLDQFLQQQQQTLQLLDWSRRVHLNKVTTQITLPVLRFYLGTTLRFVVYHNERHIWQAGNALNSLDKKGQLSR